MAVANGPWVGSSSAGWHTRITAEVVSQTDAAATIRCTLQVVSNYGLTVNYNSAYIYAGSSSGAADYGNWASNDNLTLDVIYGGGNSPVTVKTWDVTVQKSASAKTVYVKGYYYCCAVKVGSSAAVAQVAVAGITQYEPNAVTGLAHVREGDAKNVLSWANAADDTHRYDSLKVERQVDGGAWSEVASLSGSAVSYADTATAANHFYSYRVRPQNTAGYGEYAGPTAATYNTPAAPVALTAARSGEAVVAISIDNPSITAAALELQRSSDGLAWADAKTVEGACVTSAVDSPGGGTFYYRARNVRGELASAWSPASNAVVTVCPPAAPVVPVGSIPAVVQVGAAGGATLAALAWSHSPVDGSAQQAAQVQWCTDWAEGMGDAAWENTVNVEGAEQKCDLDVGSVAVGATVHWRVRTKGAHADYGPWAGPYSFKVYQAPAVVVTSPSSNDYRLQDVPLTVEWSYSDMEGFSQMGAQVQVLDAAGMVLRSRDVQGAQTSASFGMDDVRFANGSAYRVRVVAVSTSSLSSAAAIRDFSADFVPPAGPSVRVDVDEATASATVNAFKGADAEGVPATMRLSAFRLGAGGEEILLAGDLPNGGCVIDRYPPLDVPVAYRVVAFTENGLTSHADAPTTVPSNGYVYFNFGSASGHADVAKVAMDAEWGVSAERDSSVVEVAGSEDPMVFYGSSVATEASVSGSVWLREGGVPEGFGDAASTAEAFRRMRGDAGTKVVRFPHGEVMPASTTCSLRVSSANSLVAQVEVAARKVRGDGLVI